MTSGSLPAEKVGLETLFDGAIGRRTLKIVCIGAHPDDAETGCGGTLAQLADAGHRVTILYITRGEAGTKHLPSDAPCLRALNPQEAVAALRAAEAAKASELLGAKALFWNQPDGGTSLSRGQYHGFNQLLAGEEPDVVFAHWPIDTHRDHRSASLLAYDAWQSSERGFVLAYYEVMTGIQTHQFQPNYYVDISSSWLRKRSACYAHESQKPDRFCLYHDKLETLRGREAGLERAEAFTILKHDVPLGESNGE